VWRLHLGLFKCRLNRYTSPRVDVAPGDLRRRALRDASASLQRSVAIRGKNNMAPPMSPYMRFLQPLRAMSTPPSSPRSIRISSSGLLLYSLLSAAFELNDDLSQFAHDRLPTFVRRTGFVSYDELVVEPERLFASYFESIPYRYTFEPIG
jgi:hypothetical protein